MPEPPIVTVYTGDVDGLDETTQWWGKASGPHRTDGPAVVATSLREDHAMIIWYERGHVRQHLRDYLSSNRKD